MQHFFVATYNNMQQGKCITKSTNVRRFVEKVTHRYHSVDAPLVGSPWANACLADGEGFWGRFKGAEGLD
jgi:hypothetical protein